MAEALGDEAFLRLESLLEGDGEILRSGALLYLGLGLGLKIGLGLGLELGPLQELKWCVYGYESVQIRARDRDRVKDGAVKNIIWLCLVSFLTLALCE